MSRSSGKPHERWYHGPYNNRSLAMATCPDCGKIRYRTRADAKRAERQLPYAGRPYRCGDYWHLTSQNAAARAGYREAAG